MVWMGRNSKAELNMGVLYLRIKYALF